jgi:hypothetical protein
LLFPVLLHEPNSITSQICGVDCLEIQCPGEVLRSLVTGELTGGILLGFETCLPVSKSHVLFIIHSHLITITNKSVP